MRGLLLFLILLTGPAVADCHGDIPCLLGERSYHIREPDEWDGVSPLPILLHFHGWMRQGDLVVNHRRIAGATRRRGVLLVAPNGAHRSWDFWTSDTDDVAFAQAVIEDVAQRYPIDRDRIFVSGYSYGAAMAWRYACENGNGVAALLSISGTLRQSETCPEAPREVRHVHGLADNVMDFPMGPNGDTTYPVALWRRAFACSGAQDLDDWNAVDFLTFQRTAWTDCAKDGRVTLDIHSGGHFIPHGWIGWQLDELFGRVPQYP